MKKNIFTSISPSVFIAILFNIIFSSIVFDQTISDQKPLASSQLPYFNEIANFAQVDDRSKSMSAAWIDYDEDGFVDLFVCNGYNQKNILYRNQGNGTFLDITASISLVSISWTNYSFWIDIDNDGWIDLLVSHGEHSKLYKNIGDGTFADVTEQAGVGDSLISYYTVADYSITKFIL